MSLESVSLLPDSHGGEEEQKQEAFRAVARTTLHLWFSKTDEILAQISSFFPLKFEPIDKIMYMIYYFCLNPNSPKSSKFNTILHTTLGGLGLI